MNDVKAHERNLGTDEVLRNRASAWRVQAVRGEEGADQADSEADALDRGYRGMGDGRRKEATAMRRAAKRHEERAAHADHGALLVSQHEHRFMLDHSDLHGRAAAEGRVLMDDFDPDADDDED